ncbi:MAG: two-component sensor histidine kinase [Planctomycetaceae bacterium]|nr:two-component sensor histidine kinase [Planctomycetaceae bacterium]
MHGNDSRDVPKRRDLAAEYTEFAQLAGGLAHEIRNPLSTIRMNLELLSEDVEESDDPRLRRMTRKLDRIRNECLHLEEILTAFLQFARAGELQLETIEIGDLVQDFIDIYRPQAERQRVTLIPHLAANLPPVQIDPRLIRQVLTNLTLNAEQAMPDGGQIEFQTFSSNGQVCLALIDTGKGISEAARAKLFDVFFSTKPGGSGLGLPTARKIVEAHGGTITCESEPGKGTRFVVTLPAAE